MGWTALAWIAMLISYFLLPAPGDALDYATQPYNVNYVFGPGEEAQTWMSPGAWLAVMLVGLPLAIYLPSHYLLAFWGRRIEKAQLAA